MDIVFVPAAAVAVVAGLAVELRLFSPGRERREAILWSIGWLLLALAVAVGMSLGHGPAGEWTTVYLIERSLSLDNVFLFSFLLAYFLVPPELRGRVILIGIAGALLLRGIAIERRRRAIESVEAVVYVFGLAPLPRLSGLPWRSTSSPTQRRTHAPISPASRSRHRRLPGRRLFVREAGRRYGTPLLLVVVAIIVADIAFAVDSIPAAFAVTHDPLVIWTANAFALLGLGSLLALVELLVRRFRYSTRRSRCPRFVGIKILAADLSTSATSLTRRHPRLLTAGSSPPSWPTV